MKSDIEWKILEQSGDPLLLIQVIEIHVLPQTEDMYSFASLYEQELKLYNFNQNDLTNDQWCKRFIIRSDFDNGIGVTRQHKVLLEQVAKEKHSDSFENITEEENKTVRVDEEEKYLTYILLQQSGRQHVKLKSNIHNG